MGLSALLIFPAPSIAQRLLSNRPCTQQPSPRHVFPMDPKGERKLFMNGFLCKDPETIMPSDFKTSTMLKNAGDTDNFVRSSIDVVTAAEFPGLNALGLSVARTDLAMDGMILPNSHLRGSEMMYVVQGTTIAGFIDTKDRPYVPEDAGGSKVTFL